VLTALLHAVDLSLEWERYPAAMTALNNTIGIPNVKILAKRHWDKIPKLQQEIQHYLTEVLAVVVGYCMALSTAHYCHS